MRKLLSLLVVLSSSCVQPNGEFEQDSEEAGPGGGERPRVPGDKIGLDEQALSGARLKRQVYAGADGSRVFVGMWDGKLETRCGFLKAEDGKIRCLPSPAPSGPPSGSGYFADQYCLKPLLIGSDCGAKYGIIFTTSCGVATATVYRVESTRTMFINSGTCQQINVPANLSAFTIGARVDPSEFVAADLITE